MKRYEALTADQVRIGLIALAKETPSNPTTPEADRLKRDLEAVAASLRNHQGAVEALERLEQEAERRANEGRGFDALAASWVLKVARAGLGRGQ